MFYILKKTILIKNTNGQWKTATVTNRYDVNGSVTNRSSLSEQNAYSYNLQNKLATAVISRTDSGQSLSETANFTYDYHGNRVRAQWARNIGGNGTNFFLYEPNNPSGMSQVLEELPSVGATPTVSYTLGSRIVSQGKGGTISHLLSDGHGSTRQLVDTNGNITSRFSYDAYGKPLDFTPSVLNPTVTSLLYSSGQLDADLQLYNQNARYYNPVVGRFNQIDPFSDNQQKGANLYAYCAGDPVNNSDPSGMYEIDVHQFLTRFLAQAVGFTEDEAKLIGREAQGPDYPGDSRGAMDEHGCPHPTNYKLYHFVSFNRLLDMEEKVLKDYEADKLQGPDQGQYKNLGEFIHADEDTFAHSTLAGGRDFNYYGDIGPFQGQGGICGHAVYGHDPDHTWTDVNKGMYMAEQLYLDMQFAPPGRNKAQWSKISKQIRDFMEFTPNVYSESVGGLFQVENVTYKGYTEKIHFLDPSSKIEPYDTYSKVYNDVDGFKPKNVGLQLKPSVGTGIPIGIDIGILTAPMIGF
jgi:RHS repeat-associated protein